MFEFSSEWDADANRTLGSLVKYSGGFFKSEKQASFILSTFPRDYSTKWTQETADFALRNFGIPLPEGTVMCMVSAYVRWVDYGAKSIRPVSWIYVLDSRGVVAQYKLGYVGDMRSGTAPDASKTTTIFTRAGEIVPVADKSKIMAAKASESTSEHIGTVGSRITMHATIVSVKQFEGHKFHYYDSGMRTITRLVSDGNEITYFGYIGEKNETVELKCTVKEHSVYNGVKQTVISRPKVVNQAETVE